MKPPVLKCPRCESDRINYILSQGILRLDCADCGYSWGINQKKEKEKGE
jgi:Zn ribbon nucleic-acid-binding protein